MTPVCEGIPAMLLRACAACCMVQLMD